jgi:hypothetical protein
MEIESSLLGPEINDIIGKGTKNIIEIEHTVVLHTVDKDIELDMVASVEFKEDYNGNYSDEIYVEVFCPMGDFVKLIYPYRNNLEISVIKKVGTVKEAERYKCVLTNINENYGSGRYKEASHSDLNTNEMKNLRCQCLDRSVEGIRLKTVEGVYRDHTLTELLVGLFHVELNKVKINGVNIEPIINIMKADNERKYNHIIVPSGMKLVDLPVYLQEKDYGIYNGHIGLYIKKYKLGTYFKKEFSEKKTNVFIYPLYNPEITKNSKNKLIIYNIPNYKYSMVENTYLIDGDNIKIIASEDSRKSNTGDDTFMDKGVGFISLDAKSVMRRPFEINPDGVSNNKNQSNNETYMKERSDGSMYRGHNKPTDNLYNLRSNYLKEQGDLIQITWGFSDTKYLLPGMAIIYVYLGDNNDVIRLNGVLQSHYTIYNQPSKKSTTILNIFVEKDKNERA